MLIFEYFNVLTKLFHFTGHAPLSSLDASSRNCTHLLPIIFSSMIASLVAMFLILVSHLSSYGLIHSVIRVAAVVSGLFVILSANCECWRHKVVYQQLVQRIHQMEKFLIVTFSLNETNLIPNSYKKKVLMIFSLFFVSQALVFSEVWQVTGNFLLAIFVPLLRITHPISVAHFMLYNDTVTTFIKNLNLKTKYSPPFADTKAQIEFLKNIKLTHLNIWKLVRHINVFFGWNSLFIIIHSFFYIQAQSYWIFLTIQVNLGWLGMMGKFDCNMLNSAIFP